MPSQNLLTLCDHIDRQKTDSLGRFYLYTSLLSSLTVRTSSFDDTLPKKHTRMIKSDISIDTGPSLAPLFYDVLMTYQKAFEIPKPGVIAGIETVLWTYLGKSQLNDLVYINKKMALCLNGIQLESNKAAYENLHFKKKECHIIKALNIIDQLHEDVLVFTNGLVHGAICSLVIFSGLLVTLTAIVSSPLLLVTCALLAAGVKMTFDHIQEQQLQKKLLLSLCVLAVGTAAVSAVFVPGIAIGLTLMLVPLIPLYSIYEEVCALPASIENKMQEASSAALNLGSTAQSKFFDQKNIHFFKPVVASMTCLPLTYMEQISGHFNPKCAEDSAKARNELSKVFA